jgi:hypothetical protein
MESEANSQVKGVYFQWHNEHANPVVKDWNVAEMRVCSVQLKSLIFIVADK